MSKSHTADELSELLDYDPETGIFKWKSWRRNQTHAGDRAGYTRHDGYLIIGVGRKQYLGHRVAWLLTHGDWPPVYIDHIDGNPANNAIKNLRAATQSQNAMNMSTPPTNTSGVKGVSFSERFGKYEAYITVQRKRIKLGYHRDLSSATEARSAAERQYFGGFARSCREAMGQQLGNVGVSRDSGD